MTAFRHQKNFALDPAQRQDARQALADLPEGMTLADAVRRAKQMAGIAVEKATLREVAAKFMDSRAKAKLRGATVLWYENKLKPIIAQFGGDFMDGITRPMLTELVESLPVEQPTKASHYRAARALWRWARAQEPALAGRDVTEGIKVSAAKVDSDGASYIAVEDVAKIMHGIPAKHRPAAALLFFAGIRPQELAGHGKPAMLWKSIDPVGKTIAIEANIAKTRTRRVLQGLPDTVWAWLSTPGKSDEPIARCTSQQLIRVMQRAGGYWKFTGKGRRRARKTVKEWPHDGTRHSFATYHIAAFDDPGKCALLLGHGGNPRMLYTHYLGLATKAEALGFWGIKPNAADHAQPKAVACGRLLGGRFTKSTNKNKKHNVLK